MAACSVHALIRLSRNCLRPPVSRVPVNELAAGATVQKTAAHLRSLATEQDPFTGSCKRETPANRRHYFVGLDRAHPDQGIHSPAFLSSIYTAYREAPAGPTLRLREPVLVQQRCLSYGAPGPGVALHHRLTLCQRRETDGRLQALAPEHWSPAATKHPAPQY